jgi:hypothetical protein
MKKAFRALAFLSAFELLVYLAVAVAAWAIADHDLATLDRSFYDDARSRPHAQVVAVAQLATLCLNGIYFVKILRARHRAAAFAGLLVASGIVSLYFLPTLYSALGLAGLAAALVAFKLLALLWRGASWPFRKLFARKPDAAAADAKPAAPPKRAG